MLVKTVSYSYIPYSYSFLNNEVVQISKLQELCLTLRKKIFKSIGSLYKRKNKSNSSTLNPYNKQKVKNLKYMY